MMRSNLFLSLRILFSPLRILFSSFHRSFWSFRISFSLLRTSSSSLRAKRSNPENKRFLLIIFLSIFTVSGCGLYTKAKVPPLKIPENFKYSIVYQNEKLCYFWWKNFKDPKLNTLVETALANNLDYQATLKNIQIAKTYVSQYQSQLFPQVDLIYNASRNKFSENAFLNNVDALNVSGVQQPGSQTAQVSSNTQPFNAFQLETSVSYEIDIWNQVGNQVRQAKADFGTESANTRVVKLTLITNVVNTYFQIITLNANIANLKEQARITQEIIRLNQDQYQSGLIDIASVVDTKNALELIKTNLAFQEKQQQGLQNTLAYLMGEYPETFHTSIHRSIPTFNFMALIPPGLPSQMVANRPDIQSTYFQVLSYGYLTKQNLANFLPSFILTANHGFSSAHMSNLLAPGSSFWEYGLNITQPIFDAGMRVSVYKRSKLQYQQAILTYRNTVLNAFQEVDTALSAYKNDATALKSYERQLFNQKDKLSLANAQYQSGYANYLNYLNTRLSFLQTMYNATNQRLVVIQDVIQIYKTLGMGL